MTRVSTHELLEELVRQGRTQISLLISIADNLIDVVALLSPQQSITAELGGPMSVAVGATGPATCAFVDATGASQPPPTGDGSGLVVTFSIDNPNATVDVATISGNEATATVTGVTAGDYTLSAVVSNTSGAALVDDDGVTAFVQPTSVQGTVTAAPAPQATTAVLTAP